LVQRSANATKKNAGPSAQRVEGRAQTEEKKRGRPRKKPAGPGKGGRSIWVVGGGGERLQGRKEEKLSR